MSAAKKEWKDTRFPFSVDYSYSLFVKKRCIFFYCLARNVRKMINYASDFAKPYNICIIYVYGEVKNSTIHKALENKANQILLLISPNITAKDIKTVSEYQEWLKKLQSQGFRKVINQGEKKSKYSSVMVGTEYADEPSELWYENYNHPQSTERYSIYTSGIELISKYKAATQNISNAQFCDYIVISNFHTSYEKVSGTVENHNSELLKVIRELYYYGVESDTNDETAVKMLKIKKLVAAAFEKAETKDVESLNIKIGNASEQICLWDTTTVGATQCVEMLKSMAENSLAKENCFFIPNLWWEFSKPPYGAYECNWYEYIFAYVLQEFFNKQFYWGSFLSSAGRIKNRNGYEHKYKSGWIFRQNAKQEDFNRLFAELFDLKPCEATISTLTQVRSWVTENIKYTPLDWVDHNLYEILAGHTEDNHKRHWVITQQYWYKSGYEVKYLKWLKDNFDVLYAKIRTADIDFNKYIADKYGQKKADLWCTFHTVKGGAVGWLHTIEDTIERIEKYMKSEICLECGRHIAESALGYETSIHDGITDTYTTYRFTDKEIKALNKKLLGRERAEYYCMPCLCEITEYDIPTMDMLMRDFKKQGCDLFS